jgi:hypothetical protein
MSTSYDALNLLYSSVRIEEIGQHFKIFLFSEGKNVGMLCFGINQKVYVLDTLFTRMSVVTSTARELIINDQGLNDSDQLLSDYGEITTLGALREARKLRQTD